MHKVAVLKFPEGSKVIKCLVSGDLVFALTETALMTIDRKTMQIKQTQEGTYRDFMHPSTYVNKLLMAGENSLHLVNVVTQKTVFDFADVMKKADSTITCM